MVKASNPYKIVKLPTLLTDPIDKLVEEGKYGYKTRAEFVKEGCRVLLRQYSEDENPSKEAE